MAAGNFYSGTFYNGGFFGSVDVGPPAGGKDDKRGGKKGYTIKPLGLMDRPKSKDKAIDARLQDQAQTQADIAGVLAREFRDESDAFIEAEIAQKAIADMTAAEIEREIGILIRRKMRREEEEIILLMMMVSAAL